MVNSLTPAIISLQATSREPITVYINSDGGNVLNAQSIGRLLRLSNQDSAPPCRIITVVTERASSAPADMLSSGDYAIAFPDSTIFYHGVRQPLADPLTIEVGASLTEHLKISNDRSAMELARNAESRFMFRFVLMRYRFDEYRTEVNQPSMSDLDCFVALISERLSESAQDLVLRARKRHERYSALLEGALLRAFRKKALEPHRRLAETEAVIIKKIIDIEVAKHKRDPDWSFHFSGLSSVNDDFWLLNEYVRSLHSEQFKRVCHRWGPFALTSAEQDELSKISDEAERKDAQIVMARPHFEPLFSYLVALCHALQEGEENYMTALDAYWLGLIDEVMGVELQSLRFLSEFNHDSTAGDAAFK